MREIDHEVAYVRFEHSAPDDLWAEVASLFVSSFAAPPYNESPAAALSPSSTVIVQELAVDENFRGRGIAKQCIRELLSSRTEQDAVLGVFGQAAQAREMYRRWGFSELGTSPLYGGTVTLHALHN